MEAEKGYFSVTDEWRIEMQMNPNRGQEILKHFGFIWNHVSPD